MFLVSLLACQSEPKVQMISQTASVMQQVELDPANASTLCRELSEDDRREFCLLYALELLPKSDIDSAKSVCSELSGNAHSECWFQVAERTKNVGDCVHAGRFEVECRTHLCLQDLLHTPTTEWSAIEQRAKKFGMDLTQPSQTQMLYHYYFRNMDQLSLEQCATMSEVEVCQRSIISLYARRVKEWDQDLKSSCDSIPEKIQHGEQPLLKKIFDDVIERKCP